MVSKTIIRQSDASLKTNNIYTERVIEEVFFYVGTNKVILFALCLLGKLEAHLWACLACVEGKSINRFTIHVYFSDSLKYVFLWFFKLYFSDICEQVCERVWPALKENQWSVLLSESQTLPLTLA